MYAYHCWDCGWDFTQPYDGHYSTCPNCGGEARLE